MALLLFADRLRAAGGHRITLANRVKGFACRLRRQAAPTSRNARSAGRQSRYQVHPETTRGWLWRMEEKEGTLCRSLPLLAVSKTENGGFPPFPESTLTPSLPGEGAENLAAPTTCEVVDGHALAGSAERTRIYLTGNTARRRSGPEKALLWDDDLPGFALRIRVSGHKSWLLVYRRRGMLKWVTLGRVGELSAKVARSRARTMLAEAALDGLPAPRRHRAIPTFADYAPAFWRDYAQHWKPLTEKSYGYILKLHLLPAFGHQGVEEIARTDVMRWRDEMAGIPCTFKNAIPLLSTMLRYAELLGYRRTGSNPCRGVPRFKLRPKERYLIPQEFRRLAGVLAAAEAEYPTDVVLIRLLIYTGARVSELLALKTDQIEDERLRLADSKTGPRYLYLNWQARALLAGVPRSAQSDYLFPDRRGTGSYNRLNLRWVELRRRAAIPDVRLHDLRHSFASVGINANIPLATIGRLLGHVLPETTARYAHLMDDVVADAAQRVCRGIARQLGLAA